MLTNIEKNEVLKSILYSILPISASSFLKKKGYSDQEIDTFVENNHIFDFDTLLNFIAEVEVLNLSNKSPELSAKAYLAKWNYTSEEINYILSTQSLNGEQLEALLNEREAEKFCGMESTGFKLHFLLNQDNEIRELEVQKTLENIDSFKM